MFVVILQTVLVFSCARVLLEGNREDRNIRISNPYKGTVSIPFEFINNLVVIPVRINNSPPLKFILDTGVGRTLITELGVNQAFEINYQENIQLNGLGSGSSLPALVSRDNKIYLDEIEGENHTVVFLLEGRFNLSNFMGTQVNGLIGYDIFENFIVEIDYDREFLYLHDPDYFKKEFEERKRSDSWVYLPFEVIENKLYTNAQIVQSDSSVIDVKLLIDSGASHTVFLYPNTDKEIKISPNLIYSYLGTGLNGEILGKISRVKQINLAGFEIENPIVSYPDDDAIEQAILRSDRNGSIGADILKRFDIIYSYQDSGMLIRKNNSFKDSFRYNASGIEIITPVLDLPYYLISEVRENSPAAEAGLKKGDILLWVETKKSFEYSLNELIDIFHSVDEKNISLIVQRETEKLRFIVKLKNELSIID